MTDEPPEEIQRFEVTLQRKVIVYATGPTEAERRATLGTGLTAISITHIPPDKGHGPEVDLAPGSHGKKK
jgi:hypothetical protein